MDKKVIYILIAVVAVIAIIGVALAATSNNNPSEPAEKTIVYHGNGGLSGGEEQVTKTSNTIPTISWYRDDYQAAGYTVSSDGTGTVYNAGDKAPDVTDLYVKWEKNTKTTVYINDLPSDLKVTCNDQEITNGQVLTDEDCTFVIKIENRVADKYTFEKSTQSFSNVYYIDEGTTKVYSVYPDTTAYPQGISSSNVSREDSNHTLVYTLTNIQTFTLYFGTCS